ncbi:MAG: hypothetical protein WBV45_13020 [Lutimonas sp.]
MIELKKISRTALAITIVVGLCTGSCSKEMKEQEQSGSTLEGTWKMTYAEIRENDSVQVKDLSSTDFIKIINQSHFAFFNQERDTQDNFTAGAGTYTFDGSEYVENLDFINFMDYRGHTFSFQVEIKGDSLIQQGHEKIEASGIDRYILEKYVRIEN